MLSTGEINENWNEIRGNITLKAGQIQAVAHSGGDVTLFSGSSDTRDAGDINIVSGSSQKGGGHINIISSSSRYDHLHWMQHPHQEVYPKEINFGFDDYTPKLGFEERKIALQLKKTKDSTR